MTKASKLIIAAVFGASVGLSGIAIADNDHKHHGHKGGEHGYSEKAVKKELNLTEEQIKEFKAKKEEYRAEREKLEQKHRQDAETILTDEQREKVKALKQAKKDKMIEKLEQKKQALQKAE